MANTKIKKNVWIALLAVLLVVGGSTAGYFIYQNALLQSQVDAYQDTPIAPPANATSWHFIVKNTSSIVLDDNEVYGYLYTYEILDHYDLVSDFTQSDFDDLGYSNFVLDKSELEHNDTYVPKVYTYHWLYLNGTGYNDKWMNLDSRPLGDVNIEMVPTPSSVGMTAYSSTGNTTIDANTTDQSWTIVLNMLDSDLDIDADCGYSPYYNFTAVTKLSKLEESKIYNMIILDFNGTAISSSDVDFDGYYADVKIESDKMIFLFNADFLGSNIWTFELSDDLGVDYTLEGITFQTGTVESYSQIAVV